MQKFPLLSCKGNLADSSRSSRAVSRCRALFWSYKKYRTGNRHRLIMESVALHDHRDLVTPCAEVMNEEWPRSLSARIHSLEKSNDQLPYNIVLIDTSQSQVRVLGHSRITSVIGIPNACFVESVVVKKSCRGQGLGRRIMADTEKIAAKLGFEVMFLTTHDQQGFYSCLGYEYCVPVVTAGGATGLLSKIKNNKFLESLERLGNCATKMDQPSSSGLSQPSSVSTTQSTFVSPSNPTKHNVPPPPPVPHIHDQPPVPPPPLLPHNNGQPLVPPPSLLPHTNGQLSVPPPPPLPHINCQPPVPPPPPLPNINGQPPVPPPPPLSHSYAPPPVPPPAPPVPGLNVSQSLEPPHAPVPPSLPPPPSHEKVVRMDPSQISWMKKNLILSEV